MREQELWKKVPIYFYYLSISKHKDAKDDSAYSTDQIIIAFSQLLEYIMTKGLSERKKDITSSEKVVWLDSYEDLKNGNYDVIFKSANTTTFGMKSTLKLCRSEDDERDLRMETKKRHIYAFALQKAKTGFLQFTKAITMA